MAAFEFIELTTASTRSRIGCPVLRLHTGRDYNDDLPGDPIADKAGRLALARDVVIQWLAEPGRTAQDCELGRRSWAGDRIANQARHKPSMPVHFASGPCARWGSA